MSETAMMQILEQSGGRLSCPPVLIEAHILVKLSGEAVLSRLCRFAGPNGDELCLRPDLTVPLAMSMPGGRAEKIYCSGPVFLYPQARSSMIETPQLGFEWFGGKAGAQEDAAAMALTLELVAAAGVRSAELYFSDMALWRTVLDQLHLPADARNCLLHMLCRGHGDLSALLQRDQGALAGRLASLPMEEAITAITARQALNGDSMIGRRSTEDIARRLTGIAAISASATEILTDLLGIEGTAREAADKIAALNRQHRLGLDLVLDIFVRRLDALAGLARAVHFRPGLNRRFDYYDGLVFEIIHPRMQEQALARGGRYDGLLERLGATPLTAIGGALRPDRLQQAALADRQGR